MTIDQRATSYVAENEYTEKEACIAYAAYCAGAREQKDIDHEEWKKDMRFVNVQKQELIDKACKIFCRFCPHQCESYPHDDCQVQIEFRKALTEEQ